MEQWWHICLLSFAMFIGSYISGMVPLGFSLEKEQINKMNVAGSGLLVGTALSVIIPEGVSALYSQKHHEESHSALAAEHDYDQFGEKGDHDHEHHDGEEDEHHHHDEVHQYIGLSLLIGFLVMLLIDNLGGSHGHSHGGETPKAEAAKLLESGEHEHSHSEAKASTATIGLVVHAAADGLALGAASASDHPSLQIIVFLAIMLHKAPASFGLVTYLLTKGIQHSKIKKHLAIFALAAPITAMLSYLFLSHAMDAIPGGTGTAMLFSAGTFLYVATVHVLPEVGRLDGPKLLLMVVGAISPLILSLGHSH